MKFAPAIAQSISIFDSEDVVDKAYSTLLNIMELEPKADYLCAHQLGGHGTDMTPFYAVIDGIYIPGSTRSYWLGRFDVGVDDFPKSGCVYVVPNKDQLFAYVAVTRQKYLEKKDFGGSKRAVAYYKMAHVTFYNAKIAKLKKEDRQHVYPVVTITYFQIEPDGTVNISLSPELIKAGCNFNVFDAYNLGAGALSLLADRKYLWNIRTSETCGKRMDVEAKADFGIEEEMVKSLCYARSAPLTPADRKRPILHWVRQHKRRIEKGIDVDVRKHLRGITEFTMGDLAFSITEPVKRPLKRLAA